MTRYERYKRGMDILGRAADYVEELDIDDPEELKVAQSISFLLAAMYGFHRSVNPDANPDVGFWVKSPF